MADIIVYAFIMENFFDEEKQILHFPKITGKISLWENIILNGN